MHFVLQTRTQKAQKMLSVFYCKALALLFTTKERVISKIPYAQPLNQLLVLHWMYFEIEQYLLNAMNEIIAFKNLVRMIELVTLRNNPKELLTLTTSSNNFTFCFSLVNLLNIKKKIRLIVF